ncbi:MAG: TonB-dependent receptor, partial [Alphaproteobacteria bacterium]
MLGGAFGAVLLTMVGGGAMAADGKPAADTAGAPTAAAVPAQDRNAADDAQAGSDSAGAAEEEELEQILVVGSRRRGRTVADSPVPIDVVSADAILSDGFTETNLILANLLPSFNFPQPSITDGTDSIRPATLRGLGPDQTLVLVNGKRRHASALLNVNGSVGRGSSAVDLNTIPPTAIQRIEVLRDGAAAQYGSDAIAGVINVVLKDSPEGGSLSATYGQFVTTLDGVPDIAGVALDENGLPQLDDRGNIVLVPTGKNRKAHDGETLTVRGDLGLPVGEEGFFHIAGEYRDRNPTNRAGFDPRPQFADLSDVREITFNRLNHRFGNSDLRDINVFYNAGVPINDSFEFYSFGSLGDRRSESAGFYRRAKDSRNVPEIYPDGFLPMIRVNVNDWSAAGGVRGETAGWNVDTSLVWGVDEVNFGVTNSLNTSLGPTSPTEFDAGALRFRQFTWNTDLQREFDIDGLESPLTVAFGGEYRDERYQVIAGEPASYIKGPFTGSAGSQVFPGFQPSNEVTGDRHSWAFYTELDADVTQDWNVSVAGRFEDYSDFGSTLNGKLATRYQLIPELAVRGSVSSGFRAPSLSQRFFTSTATVFIGGEPFEVGTFPVESPVAQALGAKPLKPEKSVNFSAGLVADPTDELNVTLDYYRITIDKRIVLTENLSSSVVVPILTAAGITGVQRARFFINGIDTRTQGIDLVATWKRDAGNLGNFDLTVGFNYNDTKITRFRAAPGPLAAVDLTGEDLFSRREQLRFEKGQPKTKLNVTLNWFWKSLKATLRT